MSQRQIEVCAARLPPKEREQFLELMAEARLLGLRSVAVRKAAWEFYRTVTGLPKRREGSR